MPTYINGVEQVVLHESKHRGIDEIDSALPYIDNNVTNLTSTKGFLKKLSKVIPALVKDHNAK